MTSRTRANPTQHAPSPAALRRTSATPKRRCPGREWSLSSPARGGLADRCPPHQHHPAHALDPWTRSAAEGSADYPCRLAGAVCEARSVLISQEDQESIAI